jgi:regulation of enolase protein 1 (concanavalin A-like superfamily)
VWLQIVRVGDVFCTHYSLDGETFYMVRLFHMPAEKSIKVGIEAQSPAGEGGLRFYSDISLEKRSVANLRAGI